MLADQAAVPVSTEPDVAAVQGAPGINGPRRIGALPDFHGLIPIVNAEPRLLLRGCREPTPDCGPTFGAGGAGESSGRFTAGAPAGPEWGWCRDIAAHKCLEVLRVEA